MSFKHNLFLRCCLVMVILAAMSLACLDSTDEDLTDNEMQNGPATEVVDIEAEDSASEESELEETTTEDAEPAQIATASNNNNTWLVMLYQDADDPTLEEDIFLDLNEAERIGSSDQVKIAAQIDRYKGAYKGPQNFTTAKRFFLTQDDDMERITSEEVEDLGEVNMADPEVLVDFVTWAMTTYPADHYALILSDHGSGWPGGWTDPDPENDPENSLMDGYDDLLYLNELDQALNQIVQNTGVEKLDLIGMDACLMGSLEVMSALAPYAHTAVLSQETEPSLGWAYAGFLSQMQQSELSAQELAKVIVDTYIDQDTLIVDPEARSGYVLRIYEEEVDVSAEELASEQRKTVTLTAVDLSAMDNLNLAVDEFARALSKVNQKVVSRARSRTQAFESVFGDEYPSPYIDLGHFAKLAKNESTSKAVGAAADQVRKAIDQAVIAEKHGKTKKGATGISIYFPNSKLFETPGADYATYTQIANTFAETSLWDDFLTSHYTGQQLAAKNAPAKTIQSPGKGGLSLSPLEVTSDTTTVDEAVTISTMVTGENVSFLYIFTGRLAEDGSAVQVMDQDFIDAEETQEVDGVIYPYWGEEKAFPLEYDWKPIQYRINNGETSIPALLKPDTYGTGTADTYYTADGILHSSQGESDRFVRLYFNGDGELEQVLAFTGLQDTGPMREINPVRGDSVTILEDWLLLQEDDGSESEFFQKEGDTLSFGDARWTWEEGEILLGEFVVGFIVEDLDGSFYEEYTDILVR